jgi:glycosyltransferase involved in cell wall biosynthesis
MIGIVAPNFDVYSETFIRAHLDQLPTQVIALYGYPLPRDTSNGEEIYSSRLPYRILNNLGVNYLGFSDDWYQRRKIIKYLIRNKVEVVLAEYGHTGEAILQVCKEANIPLVVHFHGHDAYQNKILNSAGRNYPALFNFSAAIVVVSKDMQDQLLDLGAPEEKIIVNPYGVDIAKFKGGDPSKAPPTFVAVGRFVDKKAPHLTILAFSKLLGNHPEARLIMIGNGPLLEACSQLVEALCISNAVDFAGVLSHGEVAETMRLSRAFVQHSIKTSYGDSEGTPVAVIEACASGLPVVATRHAGIQDVVIQGETGFLVPEGDISGMADSMKLIVENSELAARLGRTGRERVKKHYSMDESINRLWNILSNAIDSREQ